MIYLLLVAFTSTSMLAEDAHARRRKRGYRHHRSYKRKAAPKPEAKPVPQPAPPPPNPVLATLPKVELVRKTVPKAAACDEETKFCEGYNKLLTRLRQIRQDYDDLSKHARQVYYSATPAAQATPELKNYLKERSDEIANQATYKLAQEILAPANRFYFIAQTTDDPKLKQTNHHHNLLRWQLRIKLINLSAYLAGRWDAAKRKHDLTEREFNLVAATIRGEALKAPEEMKDSNGSNKLEYGYLVRMLAHHEAEDYAESLIAANYLDMINTPGAATSGPVQQRALEQFEQMGQKLEESKPRGIIAAAAVIGRRILAPSTLFCAGGLSALIQEVGEAINAKPQVGHSAAAIVLPTLAKVQLDPEVVRASLRAPNTPRVGFYLVPTHRDGPGNHIFGLLLRFDTHKNRYVARYFNFNGVGRRSTSRVISLERFSQELGRTLPGRKVGLVTFDGK